MNTQDNKLQCLLIVDDSPEDRMLYRRAIEKNLGYDCRILEAELGEEGLELFHNEQPDCILLDYRLPDIDGIAFLEALKNDYGHLSTPVIMLTGQGNREIDLKAMQAGADDYLVKEHFTADLLERSIRYAIQRRKLYEQQERELRFYEGRVKTQTKNVREVSFGFAPVLSTTPEKFDVLAENYADLFKHALGSEENQETMKDTEIMQKFVEKLGILGIGPRDIIEIHRTVLKKKIKDTSFEESQEIIETGRYLVIETMCSLLLYYQDRILGDVDDEKEKV